MSWKIIDTHAQLWTEEVVSNLPQEIHSKYEEVFKRKLSYSLDELFMEMEDVGIDRIVIVGIDAETTFNYKIPNEEVLKAMRRGEGKVIGFMGIDPRKKESAVREIEKLHRDGFRGIKLVPHLHEVKPNSEEMYPIYEKAQELGIPILFHTGTQFHTGSRLKYCRPIYLDDVAVDFPNLKIIMAHFGYPWYEEALSIVRRHDNVYFNIAGWRPKYIPKKVIRLMDSILVDKALFGTDYPLIKHEIAVKELLDMNLKEETYNRLFWENASELLELG